MGRRAIIPNAVIVIISLLFFSFFLLNLQNYDLFADQPIALLLRFLVPVALAALSLFALRLDRSWRWSIANSFFAFVAAVYGAEGYLTFTQASHSADGADQRSKIEVIQEFRAKGIDAYPALQAKSLMVADDNDGGGEGRVHSAISVDHNELLPLASLPGKTVIGCNESGKWLIYRSDKFGFNNPPGAWNRDTVKLAMIGDSFTHGNCVPPDANIAGVLRKLLGGGVVNLGVSGAGPLLELAAIEEYLPALAPKTVLWFFFEGNDVTENLPFEARSPLLRSYLKADKAGHQRLRARNDEVARHLKRYLDKFMVKTIHQINEPWEPWLDFLEIYNLRRQLGLDIVALGVFEGAREQDFTLFRTVLRQAKMRVESWGGEFKFVYLPQSDRYFGFFPDNPIRERIHRRTLEIVAELEIPLIDIVETFAALPDARPLFHFPGSHYNEAGYKIVATAVKKSIDMPSRHPK